MESIPPAALMSDAMAATSAGSTGRRTEPSAIIRSSSSKQSRRFISGFGFTQLAS